MASATLTTKSLERTVPFWMHFDRINQSCSFLLTKLSIPTSLTSAQLTHLREIHARVLAAARTIQTEVSLLSPELPIHLYTLTDPLTLHLIELTDNLTRTTSGGNPSVCINTLDPARLADDRKAILGTLTAITALFPRDPTAREALYADIATHRAWLRRRSLGGQLAQLQKATARKPSDLSDGVRGLADLVRDLDELPSAAALLREASPTLREMLRAEEEAAVAERRELNGGMRDAYAAEHRLARRLAMDVVRVLERMFTGEELRDTIEGARARERALQESVKGEDVRLDRDVKRVSASAFTVLQRFMFLDCAGPRKQAMRPPMAMGPPKVKKHELVLDEVQTTDEAMGGISTDFLSKGLQTANITHTCNAHVALAELTAAGLLTLHPRTQHFTAPPSTMLALRWRQQRHVVDNPQKPVYQRVYRRSCERALLAAAAGLHRACFGIHEDWDPRTRALEALRHATALVEVPKASWLKLRVERYEGCASWLFVVCLVEEAEIRAKGGAAGRWSEEVSAQTGLMGTEIGNASLGEEVFAVS